MKTRPNVVFLSYYSVFGENKDPPAGGTDYFDSAIVRPPHYKHNPGDANPTDLNDRDAFRPVYCELARRDVSKCDESTGP